MLLSHPAILSACYLVGTVLLGGLCAYPLYLLNVALSFDFAYEKVLSRSVIVAALILLVPFLRGLNLTAADLGYVRPWRRPLIGGWIIGAVLMVPPLAFFFYVGFRVLDPRVEIASFDFATFCGVAIVSGVLVGLIEETVFRGMLLQSVTRSLNFWAATVITSLLYASMHFVEPPAVPPAVSWGSGLQTIAQSVAPLGSPGEYWDSFLSLFLLGVGFCWVRRRTGSLWWCIGLHAAFVTGIRILKELSIRDEVNPYKYLVGTYDHFVGDLTTVWLLLIGLGVYAAGRTSPKIDTRSP